MVLSSDRGNAGISLEELNRVAKLVRIKISEDEAANYCKYLSDVEKWFEMLFEVDASGLEPVTHGNIHDVHVMRQDIVDEGNIREEILGNASSTEMGFYVVKKVID